MTDTIHWTNLEQGEVYEVHHPIGKVRARLMDKELLDFEITDGVLQSLKDKSKRWTKGQNFRVDDPTKCKFLEVM